MLLNAITPGEMVRSVTDIDLDDLYQRGIRGILLDFDNTLLAWSESSVSSRVIDWVSSALERGFRLCIVSNAPDERLAIQAQRLDIPFVSKALKPTGKGINRAIELLGLNRDEVTMVGDQMFTDVLAGNRLGLFTVLVNPIYLREQWWMKFVRNLERLLQKKMGLTLPAA